jgi:hypothetical protein
LNPQAHTTLPSHYEMLTARVPVQVRKLLLQAVSPSS